MMISLNTDKAVDKTECLFMGEKKREIQQTRNKGKLL